DDHTLEVRLREPRNYFLYVLAATAAYPWPTHLWHEHGMEWRHAVPLVSNGPFVLAGAGEHGMTLRANPGYEGVRGNVAEVEIRYRIPGEPIMEIWERGELDVVMNSER